MSNNNEEVEISIKDKLKINKNLKTAATYSFEEEDHTLGNLLRSMLIKE